MMMRLPPCQEHEARLCIKVGLKKFMHIILLLLRPSFIFLPFTPCRHVFLCVDRIWCGNFSVPLVRSAPGP
jgi:hypothetical protein